MNKQVIETVKTVVIAVLITGVVAFVCGMNYQSNRQAEVQSAVEQAQSTEVKK